MNLHGLVATAGLSWYARTEPWRELETVWLKIRVARVMIQRCPSIVPDDASLTQMVPETQSDIR